MDNQQMQRSDHSHNHNEGFSHNSIFADSQQYHAYDDLFPNALDHNNFAADPNWASDNFSGQSQSRASAWPSNNHSNNNTAQSPGPSHHVNAASFARSHTNSPAQFAQNGFAGYPTQQTYQYRPQQFDPALVATATTGQDFNAAFTRYGSQAQYGATIAPQALEHEARPPVPQRSSYATTDFSSNGLAISRQPNFQNVVIAQDLINSIPAGHLDAARGMVIIDADILSKATNSEHMGNYVNIGKDVFEFGVARTPIPAYVPRKSRNELKRMAAGDPALMDKLHRKSAKKQRMIMPTFSKSIKSATKSPGDPVESVKYEGDSPSETDSSDDDGDEDDSSYESDDDVGVSPLPIKRPDSPKAATEYDTIKALWRGKRKTLDSESLRKGIVDFWEIVKTVRDRWKADQTALADAEEKKRIGELPLLRSRVKDQRDMMETAFKAALKYGHKSILELLGENPSLLYLCYQFLLDRWKEDDANSAIARAILDLMTVLTTVDDKKLEKTHLKKLFPKYISKADAKTQWLVKKIMATSSANTKAMPAASDATASATPSASSTVAQKTTDAKPLTGLKRPASHVAEGSVHKKLITGTATSGGVATRPGGITKKSTTASEGGKISAAGPPVLKAKTVSVKPSATGFFASLQSATGKKSVPPAAAKSVIKTAEKKSNTAPQSAAPKSTFSFAETMANISKPKELPKAPPKPEKELPSETADEKTKRLRKEARRKLHVTFKAEDELVDIRYFTHDPDEELGHDSSQIRDVADVGGEGMMLKMQNQMMDVDDEDEGTDQSRLVKYEPPSLIDFSTVPEEERLRNYAPHGGGQLQVNSAERAVRDQYEAGTLMAFYSSPSDVPPNPREPVDPQNGLHTSTFKKFDHPEDTKYLSRARQRRLAQPQAYYSKQTTSIAPNIDFAALGQLFAQPAGLDLQKILASFQSMPPVRQQAQAVPVMDFQAPPPQSIMPAAPAQPDIGAILAALQQSQAQAASAQPHAMHQHQASSMENAERFRLREGLGDNANAPHLSSSDNEKKGWQERVYRTKVCHFWELGKCKKGDNCTYLHEYPAGHQPTMKTDV
nr:hypothetical protein CFP56_50922 [Quercus suber]